MRKSKSLGLLIVAALVGCATGSDDVTNGGKPFDSSVAGDVGGGDGSSDVVADEGVDGGKDARADAPTDARDSSVDVADASDSGAIDTGVIDSRVDTAPIDTGEIDTGTIDTGTPDTGTIDTGAIDTGVDTGPPCIPGTPCSSGDPCKMAAITCTAGGPLCAISGKVPDGTSCGTGMVCSGGTCVSCAAGTSCPTSTPCKTATIDCTTGAPVCTDSGNLPDGTSCGASLTCTGGVCGCAAGLTDCSGTCVDLKTDPAHCGGCTTTCPAGSSCVGGTCSGPTSVTVDFPTSSDAWHTAVSAYYFWNAGDYVQGTRTISLTSITHATIHVNVMYNGLTCDHQDEEMLINGVVVGTFTINPGVTAVDTSFTFPAAAGPTYTLRYQTTRTVKSGCGAASWGPGGAATPTGSTVTLSP